MSKINHNDKAQALLKDSNIEDQSPRPWKLVWNEHTPPTIFDANGQCVVVLSTGTLSGAYTTEQIIANAKVILQENE